METTSETKSKRRFHVMSEVKYRQFREEGGGKREERRGKRKVEGGE